MQCRLHSSTLCANKVTTRFCTLNRNSSGVCFHTVYLRECGRTQAFDFMDHKMGVRKEIDELSERVASLNLVKLTHLEPCLGLNYIISILNQMIDMYQEMTAHNIVNVLTLDRRRLQNVLDHNLALDTNSMQLVLLNRFTFIRVSRGREGKKLKCQLASLLSLIQLFLYDTLASASGSSGGGSSAAAANKVASNSGGSGTSVASSFGRGSKNCAFSNLCKLRHFSEKFQNFNYTPMHGLYCTATGGSGAANTAGATPNFEYLGRCLGMSLEHLDVQYQSL